MSVAEAKYALTAAVLAVLGTIPVARENATFTKPTNAKWARVFYRSNQPQAFTLGAGGNDKANGFFQVDILYPAGTGDAAADADLEAFRAALNRRTFTHNGQWIKVMSCGNPRRVLEDNWFVSTISINWETLVPA